MTLGGIYFAACAILSLCGALFTVLSTKPVRGAMGLLATIVGIAGLFLPLEAQFLAAVQLIVYAGAVVILFVFVLLLLGADATDRALVTRAWFSRSLGVALAVSMLVAGALVLLSGQPRAMPSRPDGFGGPSAFGDALFSDGLVAFEFSTLLLIVAAVGAITVAKLRLRAPSRAPEAHATRRLFGGPVHPRDAERPLGKEIER